MRTTWTGVPEDLRAAVMPLLQEHRRLLPGWVKLLGVKYDEDMTDAYASAASEQNYGRATLTFGSGWLNLDAAEREWVVVHELGHVIVAPLERAIEEIIAGLPKKLGAMCQARYESALEESVSCLAYALVPEAE